MLKDAAPLRRLSGLFGGEVKPRKDGGFAWAVSKDNLRRCIESVQPYLLGKRQQADLLLEMRGTFENVTWKRGIAPPPHVARKRHELTDKITALKYVQGELTPLPTWKRGEMYAYVAGLCDGDGSFGVYRGQGNRYVPTVQIGMTDPTPVAFVEAMFGGTEGNIESDIKKDVHQLVLQRGMAAELCKRTAPYRTLKHEQADIVVRLHNHIQLWKSRSTHGLPVNVIAKRQAWFERTHFLNSLSVRAETNPS